MGSANLEMIKFNNLKKAMLNIMLLIIAFFLFEKIYMDEGQTTGIYSSIISVILIGVLLVLFFLTNSKISVGAIIVLLVGITYILSSYVFIGGDSREALRYISIILIIFLSGSIRDLRLDFIFKIIIILGLYFVCFEKNDFLLNRATGFFSTSPTLFSFTILIAITYLAYQKESVINLFFVLLGIILIWLTESRSTLLAGVIVLGIVIYRRYLIQKSIYIKILCFITLSILLIFILMKFGNTNVSIREDGLESTSTRLFFYKYAINQFLLHPINILFGYGAGASYEMISNLTGVKIPLHFDLLVVMYDYGLLGILGVILILNQFILKWHGAVIILLIVGNVHNLIYFPVGICLIFLTSNILSNQIVTYNSILKKHNIVNT